MRVKTQQNLNWIVLKSQLNVLIIYLQMHKGELNQRKHGKKMLLTVENAHLSQKK